MIDLSPSSLETVKRILARHVPGAKVLTFGSRVTGNAKTYSDLDLVIVGQGALHWNTLDALKNELSESDLPIMIDILDWYAITPAFRAIIAKNSEILA